MLGIVRRSDLIFDNQIITTIIIYFEAILYGHSNDYFIYLIEMHFVLTKQIQFS